MATDSDADVILQERERRRAAEQLRVERERNARALELARIRGMDARRPSQQSVDLAQPLIRPRRTDESPPQVGASVSRVDGAPRAPTRSVSRTGVGTAPRHPPVGTPSHRPREIGGPVSSEGLRRFLALDPTERFDIQLLNGMKFPELAQEIAGDPQTVRLAASRAESLMARVKREQDDPLSAGAFVREQILQWYRRSPGDAEWAARVPERWAGIFAESRVSGGRLQSWLNARLKSFHDAVVRSGRLTDRVRRGLSRSRAAEAAVSRTAAQQILAETAQSILDDLAARARDPDSPFPLVRLSELAVRRQVQTVNDALAILFNASDNGPFVVLHPNRYPDCEEMLIRPPAGNAAGAALAFVLLAAKLSRRGGGRSHSESASAASEGAGEHGSVESAFDDATIWEARGVPASAWRAVIDEARRERRRLEPPPKDYRLRDAYTALRDLLFEDADFRKSFLSVKWRGRPAGLPLLTALLQKGSIAPEISTDYEYLEAELSELAQGDPDWKPGDGAWTFRNWTVTRQGTHQGGFRYEARQDAKTA